MGLCYWDEIKDFFETKIKINFSFAEVLFNEFNLRSFNDFSKIAKDNLFECYKPSFVGVTT